MADTPVLDPHSARAEILARIRSANRGGFADTRKLSAETAWRSIPRKYHETCSMPEAERIALFTERLRDYGVGVYLSQPDQVGNTIAEILRSRNKRKILFSFDVDSNWLRHDGCTFVPDNALSYAEIEACDGVLTGCTTALPLQESWRFATERGTRAVFLPCFPTIISWWSRQRPSWKPSPRRCACSSMIDYSRSRSSPALPRRQILR